MANRDGIPSPTQFRLMSLVTSERSGREVAKLYQEQAGSAISYGTLYTTLGRLRDEGWVTVRDDADQDGRVRFFKLSGKGVKALHRGREFFRDQTEFGLGVLL
jgi:DNA-binding PadR family transcriptional regulator